MNALSDRAELIAAHLVGHHTGAVVHRYDVDGRQGVVDFLLALPHGKVAALEVTLVTETDSVEWQGLALKDNWTWPAETAWEFRPNDVSFAYKKTKQIVIRAVVLCDQWSVDTPSDLPADVLGADQELTRFLADRIGRLSRSPFKAGIRLYQNTKAEFVDAAPDDFAQVVDSWHRLPHFAPHLDKVRRASQFDEAHLFVVVVSEALPIRFFTDDFATPESSPGGFEKIDALWIWSDFWHRFLIYQSGNWEWLDFPPN